MEKKCSCRKTSKSSLALWSSRQRRMARHRVHVSRSSQRKERPLKQHVQEKLEELQKIVPGGKDLNEDELLISAASYIFQLKLQVHVLNTLSNKDSNKDNENKDGAIGYYNSCCNAFV